MNISYPTTQAKSKLFTHGLIALAALITLYWFVNIGNIAAAQLLPTLLAQTTQVDAQSEGPVPVPVPTPPTAQIQATPIPPVVAQSNPPLVPQPVPTPPAIP